MKKMYRIKGNLSLLLISAILILCAGFFIVSCGNKPQKKTSTPGGDGENSFGIDFSACPVSTCSALPEGSDNHPVPSISGSPLTIEAWVKTKSTSTSGGIFGRYAGYGAALYVKDGKPKFGIGRFPIAVEPAGCTSLTTSTQCFLSSGVTPPVNVWTHVAGVLVNESHSHTPSANCTSGVMLEKPHMDIYINGAFADCSTTGSMFADNPGGNKMSIGVTSSAGDPIESLGSSKFEATIDEIRFWGYARTPSQVNECKGTELGIGGVCDRGDAGLIAYYRLNEGEGADVSDFSGNGFSGSFEYSVGTPPVAFHWEDGWVLRTDALTPARAE